MKKLRHNKRRKTFSDNETVDIFIKTQIMAIIICFAVFIIFSFVALLSDLPTKFDFVFALISFIITSFTVGFYVGRKLKQKGMIAGVIYSLPINTLVVLVSLIFSDFNADGNLFITVCSLIVSAGIGGIVAVNSRLKR